jgi:hypothetical protein
LPELFLEIVASKNIDWNGNCVFENGKVVGFKYQDSSNHFRMIPVPQGNRARNAASQALEAINQALRHSSVTEIALILKKLSTHCAKVNKSPTEVDLIGTDYISDLRKYPAFLITEACESYRLQPSDNQFMPSSGKLISMMTPKYLKLKALKVKAEKILGIYEEPAKRENKPVSLMDALNNVLSESL